MNDKVTVEARIWDGEYAAAKAATFELAYAAVSGWAGEVMQSEETVAAAGLIAKKIELTPEELEAAKTEALSEYPPSVLAEIPGAAAAIRSARNPRELQTAQASLQLAAKAAEEAKRNDVEHAGESDAERQAALKQLWHEIEEIDDRMLKRYKDMQALGLLSKEQVDKVAAAQQFAKDNPTSQAAQNAASAAQTDANAAAAAKATTPAQVAAVDASAADADLAKAKRAKAIAIQNERDMPRKDAVSSDTVTLSSQFSPELLAKLTAADKAPSNESEQGQQVSNGESGQLSPVAQGQKVASSNAIGAA
jgi:hypothetical protein